ncbi:MAG: flagellar biosynthesis protein FliQ [Lachnospiraceae bacterium]|nr:flagellar biosynthesis protein FliQ [Lachnospiraceae bacterium]
MTVEAISEITSRALYLIIQAALPILLVSLSIGLIVSIFQTVTSIQEQTLTFIPKILGIFLTLMLLGSWILNIIIEFMTELWMNIPNYVKS